MKRVVITGIGMVSSLGVGNDVIWPKVKEGISGIDFLKVSFNIYFFKFCLTFVPYL